MVEKREPSWKKWENYEVPVGLRLNEAYKSWHEKRRPIQNNSDVQVGGTLRKNTPRNEKFGNSFVVHGVKVK